MPDERNIKQLFTGFGYRANEISRYLYSPATGIFTLGLKNSRITIHFTPEKPDQFKQWLVEHGIEDIKRT